MSFPWISLSAINEFYGITFSHSKHYIAYNVVRRQEYKGHVTMFSKLQQRKLNFYGSSAQSSRKVKSFYNSDLKSRIIFDWMQHVFTEWKIVFIFIFETKNVTIVVLN